MGKLSLYGQVSAKVRNSAKSDMFRKITITVLMTIEIQKIIDNRYNSFRKDETFNKCRQIW